MCGLDKRLLQEYSLTRFNGAEYDQENDGNTDREFNDGSAASMVRFGMHFFSTSVGAMADSLEKHRSIRRRVHDGSRGWYLDLALPHTEIGR